MVPLYIARIGDLKPGDFVTVECGACGHDGLIHPSALPSLGLGPDELFAVELGALFHDIGKIGIPEHILRKPDKLTELEWAEMKAHPSIGANLLAQVPNLERIRPIVLAHHERYDGTGYPNEIGRAHV